MSKAPLSRRRVALALAFLVPMLAAAGTGTSLKVAKTIETEPQLAKTKKLKKYKLVAFEPQVGHARHVSQIHVSDVGRVVTASGIDDGTVKIWDGATGDVLRTLHAEDHAVISPDGSWVATGDSDGPIVVWDVKTGEVVKTLAGHGPLVLSVDGATLVGEADPESASGDESPEGRVRLWSTADWSVRGTLAGHRAALTGLAISHDGTFLASASFDETIKVWDLTSGEVARTIQREGREVGAIALSPDGERMAVGYGDGATVAELWDVSASKLERELTGHTKPVSGLAFSPDGATLATAGVDDQTKLWDVATGSLKETHAGGGAVAYSADGGVLAHGFQGVELLSKDGSKVALEGNTELAFEAVFSSDGEHVIATDVTSRIDVWGVKSGKLERAIELAKLGAPEGEIVIAASGDVAAVRPFAGNVITMIDLKEGAISGTVTIEGYESLRSVVLSADGSELVAEAPASGYGDNTQLLWHEVASGERVIEAKVSGYLHVDGFVDGGENVALVSTATSRGKSKLTLKVWERKTGLQRPVKVKGIAPYSGDISFGESGDMVALGDADFSVKLYDRGENAPGAVLKGHEGLVNIAEFSAAADGGLLATASWDQTVRVWDPASGELLLTIPTSYKAQSLGFSPDGSKLVSTHKGWLRVVDLPTGRERVSYRHGDGWMTHDSTGHFACGGGGCSMAAWRDVEGALHRDAGITKALEGLRTF